MYKINHKTKNLRFLSNQWLHFSTTLFEDSTFIKCFQKYIFDHKSFPTCKQFEKTNVGFIIHENKKLVRLIDFHPIHSSEGFFFNVLLVWPVLLAQVLPRLQLILPSRIWFFGIYLNFQLQISLKNQYLPHSESKSHQINSIKFCSSRSFQQDQRHIPVPLKFSATIWFNFQWGNHSIFKNFCTASPKVMEPSPCTRPHWELSKVTKNTIGSIPVQWIS
jgi:hypothetical protein